MKNFSLLFILLSSVSLCFAGKPQMQMVLTVGARADYATVEEALNDLAGKGFEGAVSLILTEGVHELSFVPTTLNADIRLQSANGQKADVVVVFDQAVPQTLNTQGVTVVRNIEPKYKISNIDSPDPDAEFALRY